MSIETNSDSTTMKFALFKLGEERSLLFQVFACFVQDQALRHGLDRLFFVTREGTFLMEVHQSLFANANADSDSIDAQLIEASRQSTFGPTVASNGRLRLNRLWSLYPTITPYGLLRSLNLDIEMFAPYFEWQELPLNDPIERPWSHPPLTKVISDSAFVKQARTSLDRDKELTLGYLMPIFSERQRIGLVEIGWQGSIQDNLALLFPDKQFFGFYLGLAVAKNPRPINSKKFAFGPDRNRARTHRKLLNAVNVLEFLCLSLGGSVTKYTRDHDQRITAVRSPHLAEERLIRRCSIPFQQGVIRSSSRNHSFELLDASKDGELRDFALRQWYKIFSRPHPELVRNYFLLKSNEEFGLGKFRDQATVPSWLTVGLAPFSETERKRLVRYLTYSQWAEGVRKRKDISVTKRWVLYFLMRFALLTKTFSHAKKARNAG